MKMGAMHRWKAPNVIASREGSHPVSIMWSCELCGYTTRRLVYPNRKTVDFTCEPRSRGLNDCKGK